MLADSIYTLKENSFYWYFIQLHKTNTDTKHSIQHTYIPVQQKIFISSYVYKE